MKHKIAAAFALVVVASACGSMNMQGLTDQTNMFGAEKKDSKPAGPAVPAADAQPMDQGSFSALRAAVEAETMSDAKRKLILDAAKSSYFSAAQVGDLASAFNMRDDRVGIVSSVVERILDLDNPGAITAMLTFEDERAEVEQVLSDALAARKKAQAQQAEAQPDKQPTSVDPNITMPTTGDETTTANSDSSSTASCCINGAYNSCESAAAAGACMNYGKCLFDCAVDGGSDCEKSCKDKNPMISQCHAEPQNNNQCKQ